MAPKRTCGGTGSQHPNTTQEEAEMLALADQALENLREDYVKEALEGIDVTLLCHDEDPVQELPQGPFWSEDLMAPNPHLQESSAAADETQEDAIAHLHQCFDTLRQQETNLSPNMVEKIGSGCAVDDKLGESDTSGKEVHEIGRNPAMVEVTKEARKETMDSLRSAVVRRLADVLTFVPNKEKKEDDGAKSFETFKVLLKWITSGSRRDLLRSVRDTLEVSEGREETTTARNRELRKLKKKKEKGESSSRGAVKGKEPISELLDRLILVIQLVSCVASHRWNNMPRVLRSDSGQRLYELIRKCEWELQVIGSLTHQLTAAETIRPISSIKT